MEVLERFVADYRFSRGGHDLLAARGIAPAGGAPGARTSSVVAVIWSPSRSAA